MEVLDQRVIHILHEMERDGVRFPHATQKRVQFKTYELFIYIF